MEKIIMVKESDGSYRLYTLDDTVDELYEFCEEEIEEDELTEEEELDEAVKRKIVVRKGKKIRKKVSLKPGYKMVGGKEVRMSPGEMRRRKKAQKKGARLRKSKKSSSLRKRKMSMRKRPK